VRRDGLGSTLKNGLVVINDWEGLQQVGQRSQSRPAKFAASFHAARASLTSEELRLLEEARALPLSPRSVSHAVAPLYVADCIGLR